MIDPNDYPLPALFDELAELGNLDALLDAAVDEDMHHVGDLTTESIIDANANATGRIIARQAGVVCGLGIVQRLVASVGPEYEIELTAQMNDGQPCAPGDLLAELQGSLGIMLLLERTICNFLSHLSGIATFTQRFVEAIFDTKAVIYDTRKTTPGLRYLEKYAVRCGGGTMHRFGLYDALLYKDNHLVSVPTEKLASTLREVISHARAGHDIRFAEVEVDTLDQLKQVLSMDDNLVDIVLLDNFTTEQLVDAVRLRDDVYQGSTRPLLEASGGVTLESVVSIARTGVDRIAVGAITHSAPALDIALDINP